MKPLAYIFDIDGTVADKGDRDPYDMTRVGEDTPKHDVLRVARVLHRSAHILFVSGRFEAARYQTEMWLDHHFALHWGKNLWMRPDGDMRPDTELKEEIYRRYIEPGYQVLGVFDDRNAVVAMWRSLGLTCFQVAEGDF